MIVTVVELDLINYTDIASRVDRELGLGAEGISLLNRQLEDLVITAVRGVNLDPKETIKDQKGDGFVLFFSQADNAHLFSMYLHRLCISQNKPSSPSSAHRWFRIGAATGEVYQVDKNIAGGSIIKAVRLEGATNKGHILIDEETYRCLSDVCRNDYSEKLEAVTDKQDIVHLAYRCKVDVPKERPAGIVSPSELYKSKKRMSDEVFAIELLTQPIMLERDKTGSVTVTVNRREVREMLISNEAKLAKTREYVTPAKKKRLRQLDRDVQTFLADGGRPNMCLDLHNEGICLRWASGGVLSIVTDTNGKQWVPLFFRDIKPYGWNIALGTTERWFNNSGLLDLSYNLYADLNSPRTFMLREFLEESIVVNGDPQTPGTLVHKPFRFLDKSADFAESRADEFYEKHSNLREHKDEGDELTIKEVSGSTIDVTFENTKCSLKVLSDSRDEETNNLLVCFSLLDLGIEVVKAAKYNFGDGDWMLDGEIREKHVAETGTTEMELIRMPVAMMSLDYLRETFSTRKDWDCYTFGPQPSIKVPCGPIPVEEIKHFNWDVERRMKAVEGEWGNKWHRDRFLEWYDKFGSHFIKDRNSTEDEWQLSYAKPSQLFVPGTAKILNLYFSLLEGKERND